LPLRAALPRTVVVLGLVSLANDAASEMIHPLLPLFLTATLGAGPAIVGLVEGVAESTASVIKAVSGRMADRGYGAKRLVLSGYLASSAARPAIALALGWTWVLGLRFVDRIGKGLRTAPRDALIAAAVPRASLGRAFGFHRAMDHAGAVVGPLAAFVLLALGADMTEVFLWSVVPGIILLGLIIFGLPSDGSAARIDAPPLSFAGLDARLKALIIAAGLLALATLPEAFLVLWATSAGLPVAWIPLVWALASLTRMAIALPAGQLSDRVGRVPVLLGGWTIRVAILLALAATSASGVGIWLLFAAYAGSLATTEAAERSLIGHAAPTALRGTAYGIYHFTAGIFVLPGAFLLGVIWQEFGSAAAFRVSAALTAIAAVAMLTLAGSRSGPGGSLKAGVTGARASG
jgi:MFS family permease